MSGSYLSRKAPLVGTKSQPRSWCISFPHQPGLRKACDFPAGAFLPVLFCDETLPNLSFHEHHVAESPIHSPLGRSPSLPKTGALGSSSRSLLSPRMASLRLRPLGFSHHFPPMSVSCLELRGGLLTGFPSSSSSHPSPRSSLFFAR